MRLRSRAGRCAQSLGERSPVASRSAGGSFVTAVGESGAGSTRVCSTGGTNQDGSGGNSSGGATGASTGIASRRRSARDAAHSIRRHEDPGARHQSRDHRRVQFRDRGRSRDPGYEEHLEQQSRHPGPPPHRRSDRADPGVGRARRWAVLLAHPAGLGGRQPRPAEAPDVGLQSLDPVGQVAHELGELRLRLRGRARSARWRSRRRHRSRSWRRSPRGPWRGRARGAPRATPAPPRGRPPARARRLARSDAGRRACAAAARPGRLLAASCSSWLVGGMPPLREHAAESGDAEEAGEPGECALHGAIVPRPAAWTDEPRQTGVGPAPETVPAARPGRVQLP